jgi:alkanesulfonate monooxygenase SsuD/methylene tetrahydromethanopterin reductase-like flavin-dependent oxidoreductase (luciferase family)
MLIGYFTERPYQDPKSGYFGGTGRPITDLTLSNGEYDPEIAADLYNRYIDEKIYAEEMGFDALMLNEHHSTPFCMGSVLNVEAAILARVTRRAKIVLLGNLLPLWDDPLWLAEELAEIDVISRGRLVPGWIRGTGRESISHNAAPPYNWERMEEAHDLVLKIWTEPGPFRWEGKHYFYRYLNPWAKTYQRPHPQIMIPGVLSKSTLAFAARHRYPYIMVASELEPTRQSFAYYDEVAAETGFEAGPQHKGYLVKVHVDETQELAEATARKYVQGPSNPFLIGNQGEVRPHLQNLPGLTQRSQLLPTITAWGVGGARGLSGLSETAAAREYSAQTEHLKREGAEIAHRTLFSSVEEQLESYSIIAGTPDNVIPKLRHVFEYLRPGSVFFWDGDGAMTHDDAMRSLRLMGEEVIPAVREMGKELDLKSPFEVDTKTNKPIEASV